MAIGAAVVVDSQRIIGRMTQRHAGRGVKKNTAPGCRVIYRSMEIWRLLVIMTVEAMDRA